MGIVVPVFVEETVVGALIDRIIHFSPYGQSAQPPILYQRACDMVVNNN